MYESLGYKNKLENEYDLKIFTDNVEFECLEQTENLLKQDPFKNCKIRLMPDTHAGKGAVVGFTADLGDKVIPNIIGVDIGCGMLCLNLGKIEPELNLEWIDEGIRKEVPAGHESFDSTKLKFKEINSIKCYRELKDSTKFSKQIGTLGGGNHFIELDKNNDGDVYLVIHTGSRNLGKQVADYYQNLAIKLLSGYDEILQEKERIINDYKKQGRKTEIQSALKELEKKMKLQKPKIPNELCYLTGNYKEDYLHDMKICQEYAILNRETIAKNIIEKVINPMIKNKLNYDNIEKFQTIHNYLNFKDNIIRKGAISAYDGEKVIIPMNMRDGSLICIGKGNSDWNYSAPHGAGRIMSRSKAKELVNFEEYEKSMEGIFTTSVNQSTIDESPFVYKSMQEIIKNIKDTVDIIEIIKPIYNFKASD